MPQKKNNSKQTKVSAESNGDKPQNAYFLSLRLENVRCFGEKQTIVFSDSNNKPRQWTIILGDNGTGKTTILRSLITLLPVINNDSCFAPTTSRVVKNSNFFGKEIGKYFSSNNGIMLDLGMTFSVQTNLAEKEKINFELLSFACPFDNSTERFNYYHKMSSSTSLNFSVNCFAYGASRKTGETSLSERDEERSYITLFDETAVLLNPEEWLLQTDYASKRQSAYKKKRKYELELVKRMLIDVLPDVKNIRLLENEKTRTPKPTVEFYTPYGWVESKDLSLGYRTSMAWMVDFASRMFDRYPESENPLAEPAVVLIDEIDLHLHPKWQRELIDYLTNLFPNTQFIVTTHSPLIVQAAAARDANIVVCRREGDHVVIDQSVEAVRGWRADQILTSDLFELPSTRDTELEKLEKQRREILSKPKLTKADEKKLKTLSAELDDLRVMENPEDDKAMDIIRRAAAHLQNGNS